MAREKAAHYAEQALKIDLRRADKPPTNMRKLAARAGKSCDGWVELWNADRERRGLTSARVSDSHWTTYIKTILGSKHPREWARDDFRRLSKFLDGKVRDSVCTWKTATNVWGTATKMADDACNAKDDAIRCRTTNPAADVRGPDTGETTALQYLYPSELEALVACEKVPIQWRRSFATAVYTYARLGELLALTWADVDLEHGMIRITRSFDSNSGLEKTTKSKAPRPVPIEPELMPLLVTMFAECKGQGAVLRFPTKLHHAQALRDMLELAGVKRESLFKRGISVKPIRFHDLRATGLTWMAVRGDDPLKIQTRAGHSRFDTTQIYIREAETVRAGFGTPFPPLPADVVKVRPALGIVYDVSTRNDLEDESWWAQQDLNLRLRPCEERTLPLSYAPNST